MMSGSQISLAKIQSGGKGGGRSRSCHCHSAHRTLCLWCCPAGESLQLYGQGRALSPGQDEGGDNQSLMHSATADPLGRTHPNTTYTGPRGWCRKLFLLPAETTGRKHPPAGEDLAKQLCCDCLQQGHGQSHTQEGGIPNGPKPNTGGSKATHSPPAVVLAGLALLLHQEGARSGQDTEPHGGPGCHGGRMKLCLPAPHHSGYHHPKPPGTLNRSLSLQRYQCLGNFCTELLELDFRNCPATGSQSPAMLGGKRRNSHPRQEVLGHRRAGLQPGRLQQSTCSTFIKSQQAGSEHSAAASDHPVQMISPRSAPPGCGAAPAALSLLPALLGTGQEQPCQGLKLPLAMMEVLAAAHSRLQPCWGDEGVRAGWGKPPRETGATGCQRGQLCSAHG